MLTLAERKRIIAKAKQLLGLSKEKTKNDDVEQCIIDLTDAGVDEDEAQSICEEIYGDE
jgi:DNA-binding transcriptional regulator YhcF (GntR family)